MTDKKPVGGRFAELLTEVDAAPYQLTEDIAIPVPTTEQLEKLYAAEDKEGRERAMFGEHYDAIKELFRGVNYKAWSKFTDELNEHVFGKGVNEVPGKSEESSN
jgi:hypothetical protein